MNYSHHEQLEHSLTKRGGKRGPASGGDASGGKPPRASTAQLQPAWAKGLQRLYNQVVEEDIPDDLAKLLDKLDRATDGE